MGQCWSCIIAKLWAQTVVYWCSQAAQQLQCTPGAGALAPSPSVSGQIRTGNYKYVFRRFLAQFLQAQGVNVGFRCCSQKLWSTSLNCSLLLSQCMPYRSLTAQAHTAAAGDPLVLCLPRLPGGQPAAAQADKLWGGLREASTATAHAALCCLGTVPPTECQQASFARIKYLQSKRSRLRPL